MILSGKAIISANITEINQDISMNLPTIHTAKPVHRKMQLYLIDALIILCSYLLSQITLAVSMNLNIDLVPMIIEMVIVILIHSVIAALSQLNNIIWRYAEGKEYLYLVLVSATGSIFSCAAVIFLPDNGLSDVYVLFSELTAVFLLVLSRIFYREFFCSRKRSGGKSGRRLLIIGAGAAACRLLDEINSTADCGLIPVGFVDDSKQKIDRKIHGIPVLGPIEDLKEISNAENIDIIYLAIPSVSNERRAEILAECLKTECEVKSLPLLTEIADKSNLMKSVRDITPEELLGREPVQVANDDILDFIQGKKVVITGGGGSIGSEICRQIASKNPERLVIVDVYENNAYEIQQELIAKYGNKLNLQVYIATVCDYKKIVQIFEDEKPDIVIHAAAHKHVPLMETVPDEAVKNNVFGTWNTVMAAHHSKVKKMILISTDKAVNPTNIMGATKRICEMIIQYADTISDTTQFAAVRFGNVLGSNGSVIPLFKKQIEERSDVTVTHPEMTRYFMTISEASQLVLTASAMADGGEIFVLDMGEPVKIDDLAKNMIRLSGLTLGKDINIRYIGLRPGEKLYEELLMSEEGLNQTPNKKIFIGKKIAMDYHVFTTQLRELKLLVNDSANPSEVIEKKLMEIVPTFRRSPVYDLPAKALDTEGVSSDV